MKEFFKKYSDRQPGSVETILSNQEVERILETREWTGSNELKEGQVNVVFWYKLKDDGSGIFKPQNGENRWWAELRGTLFRRERAAYLISDVLGLNIVPPTVIRAFSGEVGSFQQFIDDHKIGAELTKEEKGKCSQEFINLWIFDYIIWSVDRNKGNYLLKGNKIFAIDNGVSLLETRECPFDSVLTMGMVAGESLEPGLVENFKKTAEDSARLEELREAIAKLVGDAAAGACVSRIKNIAKTIAAEGCVPEDFVPQFSFE